jgi:hypothetical protein
MKAMIPSREFDLRKAQAAVPLAAIRAAIIRVAVIREVRVAVIREVRVAGTPEVRVAGTPEVRAVVILGAATREGAVGEVIPQGDNKTPARTLKTTPKCSR